ncbi:MAG: cytochrome c-type biogenesis protein [Acidimicrobiales bacterium]
MPDATPRAGRLSFVLLLVVLGVALAIGSGVGASAPSSDAARVAQIESRVRCPSCDDISVAESTASSAIAVRHEIARLVRSGETSGAIESRLAAQYGPSILLVPPSSGLSLVVWVVPLAGGVLAAGILAVFFWKRSSWWRRMRREVPA